MSLSQDKLARAFSPRLAIQFRQLIEQNTQLFYNQKKRHQTSLIFLVPPPPHFLRHFWCFFCFSIIFVVRFFSPKKNSSKVQRCVATNFQNLHRSHVKPPVCFNGDFTRLDNIVPAAAAGLRNLDLSRYLIGQLLDKSGLPWGGGFLGAKNIGDLLKTCQRFSRVSLPKMFSLRKILKVADFVAYQAATDGT